jgi:hypothetical protein
VHQRERNFSGYEEVCLSPDLPQNHLHAVRVIDIKENLAPSEPARTSSLQFLYPCQNLLKLLVPVKLSLREKQTSKNFCSILALAVD